MTLISYDGWEPAHLSHSTVSGYTSCGKRTYLEKVARKESRPTLAAVGGVAVHRACELYDLAEFYGRPLEDVVAEHLDSDTPHTLPSVSTAAQDTQGSAE